MDYRIEHDTMGEVRVPANHYWGAQTQRSHENFPIGTERIPEEVISAFAVLKKAAALANCKLGNLDERRANAIAAACDVRPAYTLGGTGGGIAEDEKQLREICADGLRSSRVHENLIERSVAGWKEIEYEVIRDGAGNCITVCNMENFDPVGVHTGDSIVVAPSQTLRDPEHQMLRSASLNIISALGIEGGCNVQYALSPDSM